MLLHSMQGSFGASNAYYLSYNNVNASHNRYPPRCLCYSCSASALLITDASNSQKPLSSRLVNWLKLTVFSLLTAGVYAIYRVSNYISELREQLKAKIIELDIKSQELSSITELVSDLEEKIQAKDIELSLKNEEAIRLLKAINADVSVVKNSLSSSSQSISTRPPVPPASAASRPKPTLKFLDDIKSIKKNNGEDVNPSIKQLPPVLEEVQGRVIPRNFNAVTVPPKEQSSVGKGVGSKTAITPDLLSTVSLKPTKPNAKKTGTCVGDGGIFQDLQKKIDSIRQDTDPGSDSDSDPSEYDVEWD